VNREAQGVVLFLVGAAVLWASLTDLYLRYVRAGLRPILIAAGAVLIIAAIATFWYELRASPRPAQTDAHDAHDAHAHREPRVAWLLVLPLFALILVAPPALGSYAADRAGTALQQPLGFPPLPAGDPLRIGLHDYAARAVYDHGRSLGTRSIEIVGFITVSRTGRTYLTRMVFNCCAADAQPVKVGLAGQVPADLRADTWFNVTGTYTAQQVKDEVNGGPIPYIEISQARRIPPPRDQYEV
jgi:uncharacterized repeat protein (TIGR03943 family)